MNIALKPEIKERLKNFREKYACSTYSDAVNLLLLHFDQLIQLSKLIELDNNNKDWFQRRLDAFFFAFIQLRTDDENERGEMFDVYKETLNSFVSVLASLEEKGIKEIYFEEFITFKKNLDLVIPFTKLELKHETKYKKEGEKID